MSDNDTSELFERFGLSGQEPPAATEEPQQNAPKAPSEPAASPTGSPAGEQQLTAAVKELETMLKRIEQLKRSARTTEDWRAVCLYIASVKPRLTELSAGAKRIYARSFGDAFDRHYQQGRSSEGRGTTVKAIETRAKRDAALAYEVSERLERTWRDLQDLLWSCKAVADDLSQGERDEILDALPEHLFKPA
jgi:hypothetical protein